MHNPYFTQHTDLRGRRVQDQNRRQRKGEFSDLTAEVADCAGGPQLEEVGRPPDRRSHFSAAYPTACGSARSVSRGAPTRCDLLLHTTDFSGPGSTAGPEALSR